MYVYSMLMRFHYTVIYRCSELLQKHKQAPPKILIWSCFQFLDRC